MSLEDEFRSIADKIDELVENAESEITRNYARHLENVRDLIRKKHDKYAKGGELTHEIMSKYDRRKKLNKELQEVMHELWIKNNRITRKVLRDVFKTAYRESKKIVGEAVGRTIRGQVKQETIQAALQNPVSGLSLNERLTKRRNRIITDIQETVGQGLREGESYSQMSERLKDSLEGDTSKAMRVVRTEGHRVQEQGKLEGLEHADNQGVKMIKRWVSADDERVREIGEGGHTEMDGQEVAFDEDFENPETGGVGPAPGMMGEAKDDINCRCIFVVEVVDYDPPESS